MDPHIKYKTVPRATGKKNIGVLNETQFFTTNGDNRAKKQLCPTRWRRTKKLRNRASTRLRRINIAGPFCTMKAPLSPQFHPISCPCKSTNLPSSLNSRGSSTRRRFSSRRRGGYRPPAGQAAGTPRRLPGGRVVAWGEIATWGTGHGGRRRSLRGWTRRLRPWGRRLGRRRKPRRSGYGGREYGWRCVCVCEFLC